MMVVEVNATRKIPLGGTHHINSPHFGPVVPFGRKVSVKIYITSVFVDDQLKAFDFYTRILGFTVKNDVPAGAYRWLTVVSPENPAGTELLLEPDDHPAVKPYKNALVADGIPAAAFQVDDIDATYRRLCDLGVSFIQEPVDAGPERVAVFDDTCGNLIQLVETADV